MRQYDESLFISEFLSEIKSISNSLNNITYSHYKRVLELWISKAIKLNITNIKDLNSNNLRDIIQEFRLDNKRATSIRNYISILSSYYEFLIKENILDENPIKNIKKPKIPERKVIYLNDEEIGKFITDLKNKLLMDLNNKEKKDKYQDLLIILLPLSTGIRLIEQYNLNLNSFNLNDGSVKIIGKGNKERYVYIPINDAFFMEIFNNHQLERKSRLDSIIKSINNNKKLKLKEDLIFKLRENNSLFINNKGFRLSARAIQRRVKKYREELEIAKLITPHKLRHTFASLLVRKDINLFQIKEILGHSSITTTQIYLHSDNESIKQSINKKKPIDFSGIR